MASFKVVYNSESYSFDDYSAAKAKAKELGSSAVLYGSDYSNNYPSAEGITSVFTNLVALQIYGGSSGGCVDSTDLTLIGGSITNYVYAAGHNATITERVVTGTSTVTIKGNAVVNYFCGVRSGVCGDVVLNYESGRTITIGAFGTLDGAKIDGDITYNISGGSITNLFLASSHGAFCGVITGKLVLNLSGGTIGNYLQTSWTSGNNRVGATTIGGGVWYNLTGGTLTKAHIYGTGNGEDVVTGGVHIVVDGFVAGASSGWIYGTHTGKADFVEIDMKSGYARLITAGGKSTQSYDSEITVSGGVVDMVVGVYERAELTGDVLIDITGGSVLDTINAAGGKEGSSLIGDSVVNISGANTYINAFNDFSISGAGLQIGNATMNISGGTIASTVNGLGNRNDTYLLKSAAIEGKITLNITGGTFTNEIAISGGGEAAFSESAGVYGDIEINITGGAFDGSIFLIGGAIVQLGNAALNIGAVSIGGSVYAGSFGWTVDEEEFIGYVEGSQSITVDGTTIGGVLSGIGTAELEQGLEEATSTLTVGSLGVTVSDMVADFTNITIAAGGSIKAGAVVAAAITATASAEDGAYLLATGFAAQDSVITVVNGGGSTIGTVTLSEAVTSGSFNVGSDAYTVAISDSNLYLTKNADVPVGPIEPPPVVESKFTADVVLTITDTNHAYFGATGAWKVMDDQKVVWQDLSTLSGDYQILGLGKTAADKAMSDVYVYSASNKYIGAYVTDANGAVAGFESIFTGEAALMQVGLGDFNADGVSDLMLRTADGYLGFYANGAFTAVQGLGTEWSVEALGDVNGDGTTDIVIAHAQGGYVGAYLIGKDGAITWGDLGSTEGGIEIVGAGDFNADGTDDVLVKTGNYYGAWLCGNGSVTGFFGIGTFDAEVQDIADYNGDGTDDVLFRTTGGIVGAALITGADASTWAEYGALGAEWSTKGVGIL